MELGEQEVAGGVGEPGVGILISALMVCFAGASAGPP